MRGFVDLLSYEGVSFRRNVKVTGSAFLPIILCLRIRTIEQSELQELPQNAVEHGLPQEERLKNLLDKVRNPYCYLDNGIAERFRTLMK